MSSAPEPGPWLNDVELASWLNLSEIALSLPGALSARLQREAGISFYEYMVLAMLSEQCDRTLQLSELAELTSGSLSRLSHVITRLEAAGWVERTRSDSDRRARLARLTDAGMERVVAVAPTHVAHVRELVFDALTAEQVELLRTVTDAVVQRVRPADRQARPGRGRGLGR